MDRRNSYMLLGSPTNAEVRDLLRQWQARNRWTWQNLARASSLFSTGSTTSAGRLEKFAASTRDCLHEEALRTLRRFLIAFPDPDDVEATMEELVRIKDARMQQRQERLRMAPIEREQERAAYVRHHLAQERRPKMRAVNPLMGLTKQEVAALSGGTI